jgi:sialidase-1
MIECKATGLVYRNPKPYLRAVHAWHPSLVRLDSGELVASFDLGQGVESLDYRTHLSRSTDEGRTWTPPVRVLDETTPRRSTHSIRISRTADGALLGFGGRYYRDDPEEGLVNRANLGYVPMDLIWLSSRDGGRSWQGPTVIDPPLVGPSFEVCHGILERSDGTWLAPTSTWRGWDGYAPNGMRAVALVSRDRGKTWPESVNVMGEASEGLIYWEQSVTPLADGRLLALAWVFDEAAGKSLPNRFALCADGRTFAPPRENGLRGQTAKLVTLRDGRVLCLYRREDKPGLWAHLARIDGDAWVSLAEAPVWQGAGAGMSGREAAGEELSGLKFGYPSMVQLPGGDVLAVFWCVEDCIHNIRWARLRIDEAGAASGVTP